MPEWKPQPIWQGEEVFVLGGGHSLRGWDFSLLKNEHVIGCNQAWRLGSEICDIIIFCDRKFIYARRDVTNTSVPRQPEYNGLANFGGRVVTTDSQMRTAKEPWVYWMPRRPRGLHTDALGFNCNTGASALNLALLLGAKTIYLLGFDMCLSEKNQPNYHDHLIDPPNPAVYERMITSFGYAARDLREKAVWKGRQVFNVTKYSRLDYFPKLDFDEFWEKRHGLDTNTHSGNDSNCGGSVRYREDCCLTDAHPQG